MWCKSCHRGSEVWKPKVKCDMCGCMEFVDKSPLPTKPARSIRAMKRRKGYVPGKEKVEKTESITAEVQDLIDNSKSNNII